MKIVILLAVIAFAAADSEFYELKKLDMDKLIENLDELKEFTNCLLDKSPCNDVYQSYRVHTSEAIQQSCKKCDKHAKHIFSQYIQAIKAKTPSDYAEFKQKYDPENKYFNAHETEVNKYATE